MTFPKKLRLVAWAPKLEGEGNHLELIFESYKNPKKKSQKSWRGVLCLEVDRGFVHQVAQAVADMQRRDLERLARELNRIRFEVEPITGKQPTETT